MLSDSKVINLFNYYVCMIMYQQEKSDSIC